MHSIISFSQYIRQRITEEKDRCEKYLDENPKIAMPEELENCQIIKNEQCIAICLENRFHDERFEDHYAALCAMTADALKEEMVNDSEDGQRYHNYSVEEYEKLLEYCRIECFNCHIDEMLWHKRSMSNEALLDMDYFLNDDELDDDFGEEGFYTL